VCGIGALLDPNDSTTGDVGPAMIAALRHRGPDGEGMRRIGPAMLVHTRLAIVDLEGGAQPLSSEDGACTAVVNGEIYNHLDLREELEARGHVWATHSDSEAILHAYEEFGVGCLSRLNGIFAFALWDARRDRLLVARDPFGVKPVYWWTDGTRLAVASEVGALLAAGLFAAELDEVALDHYLAWRFVPAPRTLFRGVSKLAPASHLVAEGGGVRVESYRTPPGPPIEDAEPGELAGELRGRLLDAVKRQTMADVPYGAFLSGGVDSAAVVAALRLAEDRAPRTFTIGFPEFGGALDERGAAAETAAALATEHSSTSMEAGDFATELSGAVAHLEEPCGSPSAPALLQLSRFTARHVKVVLSGQGADEPLGGYHRAQAAVALDLAARFPPRLASPLRALAEALPRNERVKRAARVLAAAPGRERLLQIFEITPPELRRRLTGRSGEEAAEERRLLADGLLADVQGRDLVDQALYLDTHLVLPDHLLLYGDKMSMAAGLEHRVPFLELELMRFVERIPGRLRMRWGIRKWLYRRALRELVPAEALKREKHGFTTPYDRWLRSSLGAEVESRYPVRGEARALLHPPTVAALVREHRRGSADHKRILFCLLELAHWRGAFIERRPLKTMVGAA
jgi:asparagine synthase (glutamine-hydrolysing)